MLFYLPALRILVSLLGFFNFDLGLEGGTGLSASGTDCNVPDEAKMAGLASFCFSVFSGICVSDFFPDALFDVATFA